MSGNLGASCCCGKGAQDASAIPPVILTIAGSDSGGGAGVQADLKTISVLGGFGTSVFAALTAQNGLGVLGIHEIPPDFVLLQLRAILEGFPVRAAKTGMLSSAAIITALASALEKRPFPLVVDPVCVSQSGHRLLREDAVESLIRHILPLATLLTPNKPEAELLTGMSIESREDIQAAADRLLAMGAGAVLLKGGHFAEYEDQAVMTDWFGVPGRPVRAFTHPRVETPNNHGTGCTLSAALATLLGLGHTLEDAVCLAQEFLTRALAASYAPGLGAGPPNIMAGRR